MRTWLVGAGISADHPSNFPLARDIIRELLRVLSPNEGAKELLEKVVWPEDSFRRGTADFLRFESLLEVVQEIIDPDLSFFDFIGYYNTPNALHHSLALNAIKGDVVITTNFDGLIEQAILARGYSPYSACYFDDFKDWRMLRSADTIPVFKLHGSFEQFDATIDKSKKDARETIQATLYAVTAGTHGTALPEPKRSFFLEALEGRQLIVAGYSGLDDLDILPTLRLARPTHVTWIEHMNSDEEIDISDELSKHIRQTPTTKRTLRESYFNNLFSSANLRVIQTNTASYLVDNSDEEKKAQPHLDKDESGTGFYFNDYVDSWANSRLNTPTKWATVGEILFRMRRFRSAEKSYRRAIHEMGGKEDFISTQLKPTIERALARILVERGSSSEAEHVLLQVLSALPGDKATDEYARCLHDLGFAKYKQGDKDEAFSFYENAIVEARKTDNLGLVAVCFHDMALIFLDRGNFSRAKELLQQSIQLSERVGDIRHLAWSHYHIGGIAYDFGQFEEAEQRYASSRDTAALVGDYNHVSCCEHGLAMIALFRGQVLKAAKLFRHTLHLDRLNGNADYIPVKLEQIGICYLECKKYGSANKLFARSKKAFEEADDQDPYSELLSFWSWLHLEEGRVSEARELAKLAKEESNKLEVLEFRIRAEFMVALCNGGNEGTTLLMTSILHQAKEEQLITLVLDLIYIWARSGVFVDVTAASYASEAYQMYIRLGNMRRAQKIAERWPVKR